MSSSNTFPQQDGVTEIIAAVHALDLASTEIKRAETVLEAAKRGQMQA